MLLRALWSALWMLHVPHSHPPCEFYSVEQQSPCCSDHGAGHTFVKQVKTLYFKALMKKRDDANMIMLHD